MKAILKFNLPEENEEFETASNGWKYKLILWNLDGHLRSKIKYEDLEEKEYDIYSKIREQLWEFVNQENLTLH